MPKNSVEKIYKKTGLDKVFSFVMIMIVKPTALSVRRDGGFYL